MRSLVFVVASALAACGPSAVEIRTAKTATYAAPAEEMYRIAVATASETYKIGEEDREHLRFATRPQWYNPEGGRQSEGAGGYVQVIDRSVELTMVVEVVVVGPNAHAVNVTPVTFQHLSGSPQPRELKPDDPNLPPWIHGRVESLQLAIHNNAKQYAAK